MDLLQRLQGLKSEKARQQAILRDAVEANEIMPTEQNKAAIAGTKSYLKKISEELESVKQQIEIKVKEERDAEIKQRQEVDKLRQKDFLDGLEEAVKALKKGKMVPPEAQQKITANRNVISVRRILGGLGL